MTFWITAQKFSPILVRLLARHRYNAPLSNAEIAQRSKLSIAAVAAIAVSPTWQDIDLPTMRAYLSACNVDFCNQQQMQRVKIYLRSKPTWKYLKRSSSATAAGRGCRWR